MQRLRMLGSQRRRATAMATDTSRAPRTGPRFTGPAWRCAAAAAVTEVMDVGGMDVEDLPRRWRRARQAWDDVRQVNLSRDVAGERLNDEAQARWDHARDCPLTFRVGLVLMYTARTRHASSRKRC
jgi:hypothetical protein